jgi:hypothetical protein
MVEFFGCQVSAIGYWAEDRLIVVMDASCRLRVKLTKDLQTRFAVNIFCTFDG